MKPKLAPALSLRSSSCSSNSGCSAGGCACHALLTSPALGLRAAECFVWYKTSAEQRRPHSQKKAQPTQIMR